MQHLEGNMEFASERDVWCCLRETQTLPQGHLQVHTFVFRLCFLFRFPHALKRP